MLKELTTDEISKAPIEIQDLVYKSINKIPVTLKYWVSLMEKHPTYFK